MAQPNITFPASGTLTHKEFFFAHTAAPMIPPGVGMGVSDLLLPVLPSRLLGKESPDCLELPPGEKPPVMALGDYHHHHRVSFISHIMAFSSSNTIN